MTSALTLALWFSLLVSVACEIGVVVAIATVVRRHRPDAFGGILSWAVATLVWSLLHLGLSTIVPWMFGGDTGSMLDYQAALSVVSAVVNVGLVALLVRGLVKLAQPPRQPTADAAGPYR